MKCSPILQEMSRCVTDVLMQRAHTSTVKLAERRSDILVLYISDLHAAMKRV
jgi:hypothetical protein